MGRIRVLLVLSTQHARTLVHIYSCCSFQALGAGTTPVYQFTHRLYINLVPHPRPPRKHLCCVLKRNGFDVSFSQVS